MVEHLPIFLTRHFVEFYKSFRIAVSLRLGIPLCVTHICVCGNEVNVLYGLFCKNSSGWYARHAFGNDLIKRTVNTSKIHLLLELTGCKQADGEKLADLALVRCYAENLRFWIVPVQLHSSIRT